MPGRKLIRRCSCCGFRLINEEGFAIAGNEYLFTKEKDLGALFGLPEARLKTEQKEDTVILYNNGRSAVLFINISGEEPLPSKDFLYFDNNYFCLMPKESRTVRIASDSTKLAGRKLRIESFQYKKSVILQ